MNRMSPEAGLLVKNVIIFLTILGLHYIDGIVGPPHRQALGILLVYSAFSVIFNYQSEWISESGAENIGEQTTDGALYHRARMLFSPDVSRLIVFVLIPFLFILVGSRLAKRVKLD